MKMNILAVLAIFGFCLNLSALDPEAEMRKKNAGAKPPALPKVDANQDVSDALETMKQPWVGVVSEVNGEVKIVRHKDDDSGIYRVFKAEVNHLVHKKDEITVGDEANIEIILTNKNKIKLAPKTIFKIYKHATQLSKQSSLFNLLMGTVKASVKKLMGGSDYRMYTPNATIGVRGTEFVASYSESSKSTKIACYDGKVAINTGAAEAGEAEIKAAREIELDQGKFTEVASTYGESGAVEPVIEKPAKISRKIDGVIVRSFNTSKREDKPWDFTEVSSSLLRFGAGYEYFSLLGRGSSNFGVYYMPVFLLVSSVYVEPYFGTSFSSVGGDSTFKMRTGARLNVGFFRGLYAGAGAEIMWINSAANNFAPGITLTTGYTFVKKFLKVIDGVKFTYAYNNIADSMNSSAVYFGVVVNFTGGRQSW